MSYGLVGNDAKYIYVFERSNNHNNHNNKNNNNNHNNEWIFLQCVAFIKKLGQFYTLYFGYQDSKCCQIFDQKIINCQI
jgi:hypothetical protein